MPFQEIIKKTIGKNKNIVISRRDDLRVSIAQQIIADSDGKEMEFFLKNAIVVDEKGLNALIEALIDAKRFLSSTNNII